MSSTIEIVAVDIKLELEASKLLTEFLECADRTQRFYQSNRLPLPEILRRLLGSDSNQITSRTELLQEVVPPMPPEYEPDWTWVKAKDAAPITLVKTFLKSSGHPMRVKELYEKIREVRPDTSLNVVANAAVRLKGNGIADRDQLDRWQLIVEAKGGIIHQDHVWGPQEFFTPQEVAQNRRIAILVVLREFSDGLQMSQITEHLRRLDWLKAPIHKDLVKGDMEVLLGENKVRRKAGNSKKWELVPEV